MSTNLIRFHMITNFPKDYPMYKKIYANILYFITGIVINPRKNALNYRDMIRARVKLRKGDIALWGNLREVSSLFIKGPLTHATLYVGKREFIEAVGDGVRYSSLYHLFTKYDTLVIMRVPRFYKGRRKIIKEAIQFALMQVGKPYDFDFSKGSRKLFCTELVNSAYQKAHYDTKLKNFGKFSGGGEEIIQRIVNAERALRPTIFAEKGNFKIVLLSHNLEMREKKLVLKKD